MAPVGRQDVPAHTWKTPWSEAGLPEPGWWKAFAVDKNVRSTRTPRRIAGDHEGASAKAPAVVETVRRDPEPRTPLAPAPLSEPVSESPVASRIAGLRSVFGTSPEHEGTGEKLDARIKALREASRAPADPETARDAGSLLTRSRKRESAPAIGQPEELSATASFGWMSARYAVEILAMSASFDMSDVSEGEDFDAIDAPAPAVSASQAPVAAPEIRDEPQVHAHGADFLWLYDKPQAINAATHAVMEPEPVAMPVVVAEETRSRVQLPAVVAPTPTIPAERPGWRASESYELPDLAYLAEPPASEGPVLTEDILEESAGHLEKVIRDFGVKGEIIHVRPGPVVTLYEFEPAPGTKSARVVALSDDIARSMSAISARVAVIPGRNAIGIELPNDVRDTVYLREQLETEDFKASRLKLPLCLGKTIGGEPVIADLARMPHLLVAGTTGSGKSVAINTMILSLLYRFTPQQCRLIMVDPKMLELSVYDGIPHLLTPVVTDPKKAIIALRWAVREMEDRYKKMSKLGVRNIDGFNVRVSEAKAKGETITRTVQTGFEKETGQAVYEDEIMDLEPLPYIVVIVDEMADLMMVAGKEIEGAIQRLAQMARAAGIHVVLATQRPSVDVITGTIKANFPTRISFQVTSKIDSRTILGEMGAEQLLGQGDMLYMAGGGRITRVHGPFCSDEEVEKVVAHLKRQAAPVYVEAVTADDEEELEADEVPVFDEGDFGLGAGDLYDQAVAVVLRHKKASTSYIQRRLQIGYNRAASIMERMEKEGVVGPANHAGKREILMGGEGRDFA